MQKIWKSEREREGNTMRRTYVEEGKRMEDFYQEAIKEKEK